MEIFPYIKIKNTMKNIDLLGTGIITSIAGKITGEEYSGLLFKKGEVRSSRFTKGSILLDVKEINDGKVLSYHSAQLFNEEEFDEKALRGDYFLLLEKRVTFSRVLPADDFDIH